MNQRPVKKSSKKSVKRPGLGQSAKMFRRESRKPNPKIMVQRSPLHGLGVWAQYPIKAGEFLAEYVGQLITPEENERLQSHTDDPNHTFSFGLECGMIIDGGVEGNISRYINHSCSPNAEFREVPYAEGCPLEMNSRLFIYATQDIGAGEEIFFDYSLQYDGPITPAVKEAYKCMCGSENCRGTMLDLSYKPPRTPKERVEDLEAQVESLNSIVESQSDLLKTQGDLLTKLSQQVLTLTRQVMGEIAENLPTDPPAPTMEEVERVLAESVDTPAPHVGDAVQTPDGTPVGQEVVVVNTPTAPTGTFTPRRRIFRGLGNV